MRQVNDGTPHAIDAAADAPANAYGVHGLHGAHWEWSEDVASLLGDGDRRGGFRDAGGTTWWISTQVE